MAVFTQKPDKSQDSSMRNKTDEVFGKTTTTGLDCGLLRYIISWAAGESYTVILSQVHKSLCLIAKQQSSQDHLSTTDSFGLTSRVLPHQVVGLSGIYVDDFLAGGPPLVVHSFLASLRKR